MVRVDDIERIVRSVQTEIERLDPYRFDLDAYCDMLGRIADLARPHHVTAHYEFADWDGGTYEVTVSIDFAHQRSRILRTRFGYSERRVQDLQFAWKPRRLWSQNRRQTNWLTYWMRWNWLEPCWVWVQQRRPYAWTTVF